jgi:hypothetical protein
MTVERFGLVLGGLGEAPTLREIEEALWLACQMSRDQLPRSLEASADSGDGRPRRDLNPMELPDAGPSTPPPHVVEPPEPPQKKPAATADPQPITAGITQVHPPQPAGATGASAADIPIPEPIALDDRLNLLRALRPLRHRFPVHSRSIVDEDATARQIADDPALLSVWPPVLRPATERWFEATLVIDDSDSMQIWSSVAEEVAQLLAHSGIFRGVTKAWLRTDPAGRAELVHSGGAPADPIDSTGRRLILVLSDCVGRFWHDGSAGSLLHRWAGHGPVAILQPLPERMWAYTAAPTLAGRLRAPRVGASNVDLRFHAYGGMGRPTGRMVPVLELAAPWMHSWTRMIGGGLSVAAAVTFVSVGHGETPPTSPGPSDVSSRVRRFRSVASHEAVRLASYVALGQPDLPLIRYIHHAMFHPARPAHLAEFLLSGLLRPVDPRAGRFEFVEGATELLAQALKRGDEARILDLIVNGVSAAVENRIGLARNHFAALRHAPGERRIPAGSVPFAVLSEVGRQRLDRLRQLPHRQPDTQTPQPQPSQVTGPAPAHRAVIVQPGGVGCLLGGGRVLVPSTGAGTAPVTVQIGDQAVRAHRRTPAQHGLAVLELDPHLDDGIAPIRMGRLSRSSTSPSLCTVHAPSADPQEAVHSAELRAGDEGLTFTTRQADPPAHGSPVFCDDLLVGIVMATPAAAQVHVVPVDEILNHPALLAEFEHAGLSTTITSVHANRLLAPPTIPLLSVAHLLDPHASVVPFTGRETDLARLTDWCFGSGHSRVHVLLGTAGVGKTRLAAELVTAARRSGWTAGFLRADASLETLGDIEENMLLVVDDATVRFTEIREMLRHTVAARVRVRILIIARAGGEWLQDLGDDDMTGDVRTAAIMEMRSLAEEPSSWRELYRRSAQGFAHALGLDPATATMAHEAADEAVESATGSIRRMHLLALATVLNATPAETAARVSDAVVDHELATERLLWTRTAVTAQLTFGATHQVDEYAAAAMIFGAKTASEADDIVRAIASRDDTSIRRISTWLHEVFPGSRGAYWACEGHSPLLSAVLEETFAARPGVLGAMLTAASEEQAARAWTTLTDPEQSENVAGAVWAAVEDRPQLIRMLLAGCRSGGGPSPALCRRIRTVLWAPDATIRQITTIVEEIDDPGVLFAGLTAAAAERVVLAYRSAARAQPKLHTRLTAALRHQAAALAAEARYVNAVAVATEEMALRRELAPANPALGELDADLTAVRLAEYQRGAGQRETALASLTPALARLEQRTATLDVGQLLETSEAMALHAAIVGELGRPAEALTTMRRLVDRCRALAGREPRQFGARLAWAQLDQAALWRTMGRPADGLESLDESVALFREAAASGAEASRVALADGLMQYAETMGALGDDLRALAALDETTGILESVVTSAPIDYLPRLGLAHYARAIHLDACGRRQEVLGALDATVSVYYRLMSHDARRYRMVLAMALSHRAALLRLNDQDRLAAKSLTESIALCEDQSVADPEDDNVGRLLQRCRRQLADIERSRAATG